MSLQMPFDSRQDHSFAASRLQQSGWRAIPSGAK